MSRAVLISIRPEWCEKIADGEKTIEVRKTRPKLETPFIAYIYCTKNAKMQFWTGPRYSYVDDHSHNAFDRCGNGKVIGEFVCDWIDTITYDGGWLACTTNTAFHPGSCLSRTQLVDYIGSRGRAYGWRISNLKIYDHPKKLEDFMAVCRYKNDDGTCPSRKIACSFQRYDYNHDGSVNLVECGNSVRRPPQSWQYVEELK